MSIVTNFLFLAIALGAFSCGDTKDKENIPSENTEQGLVGDDVVAESFYVSIKKFEPSGITISPTTGMFYVVSDNGKIVELDAKGTKSRKWKFDYDFEGVTISPNEDDFLYVLAEKEQKVLKFSLNNESISETYNLPRTDMGDYSNPEAMTFVPNPEKKNEFILAIGFQKSGDLVTFEVPQTGNDLLALNEYVISKNLEDMSGLFYSFETSKLFALFDKKNILVQLDPKNFKLLNSVPLSGDDQEGIAVKGCSIFIAEDKNGSVIKTTVPSLNIASDCK